MLSSAKLAVRIADVAEQFARGPYLAARIIRSP